MTVLFLDHDGFCFFNDTNSLIKKGESIITPFCEEVSCHNDYSMAIAGYEMLLNWKFRHQFVSLKFQMWNFQHLWSHLCKMGARLHETIPRLLHSVYLRGIQREGCGFGWSQQEYFRRLALSWLHFMSIWTLLSSNLLSASLRWDPVLPYFFRRTNGQSITYLRFNRFDVFVKRSHANSKA